MLIHHYSRETGEYTGSSEAQPNPMEEGKFLIPACATEIAPPESVTEGHVRVFAGGEWTEIEDHRGTVVYDTETKQPSVIETLGPLPAGVTETAPEPLQKWDADTGAWVADERAVLLYEIAVLESAQTPRLMRDVILTPEAVIDLATGQTALAKFQEIETEIAAKRTALTTLEGGAV